MSIGAMSSVMYTKFDAEMNALFALSQKSASNSAQDSIFGTNSSGLPDLSGIMNNNSIFGAAQASNNAGAIGNLMGFQSFGSNGSPALDLTALSSLSNQQEEALVANASSGAINTILNMKIPPIPTAK